MDQIHTKVREESPQNFHLQRLTDHERLTREEEVSLAQIIEGKKLVMLKKRAIEEAGGEYEFTAHDEATIRAGDKALDKLIESNIRLVVSFTKRYTQRGLDFDDLLSEGMCGLISAANKFEWRRGFKFSTYASWWIKQSLGRAICCQSRSIRLPVHMYDKASKVVAIKDQLHGELGHEPTCEEIAEQCGDLDRYQVQEVLWFNEVSNPISIDSHQTIDEDGRGDNVNYLQIIEAEGPTPEELVEDVELSDEIEDILLELDPREAKIVRLRFGLNGYGGVTHTLEEVGCRFGLTRERVRQIEAATHRKMRHPKVARRLREYYDFE